MTVDGTVVKVYPKFDLRDEFHYEGQQQHRGEYVLVCMKGFCVLTYTPEKFYGNTKTLMSTSTLILLFLMEC